MKQLFITILCYLFLFNNVLASLFISELYPNTLDDKNLEYIELTNSLSSNMSLSWFYLQDKSEKKYIFWSWNILKQDENIKFYRSETKIILNNSDEEVYLYDNFWNLINSFFYEDSEKWIVLTSPPTPLLIVEESNSWSLDESFLTWKIDSNSWKLIDLWTWIIDNIWDWTWILLEIPDIEIEVQSWLEYLTWNIWECKKEDCKVNLTVKKIFTWSFLEKNYECLWNFWTWAMYSTWTEIKFNPGYVDYWSWIFDIVIQIYEKWNLTNFKTWSIVVENLILPPIQLPVSEMTNSWSIDLEYWTWEIDSGSWFIWKEKLDFLVPELIYNFQNPTYFTSKEKKLLVYNCDSKKEECKINLDLRDSFSWSFNESDFNCIIDFWFWSWNLTWEENKCNPNTIIIPIWIYDFNFKIESKIDSLNFSTWWFEVINNWFIKKTSPPAPLLEGEGRNSWWWSNISIKKVKVIEKIYIQKPKIIIQSWLDENNLCKNEECSINLNYIKNNSKEECLWDFWGWIFKTHDTDKKCNPWYVKYPIWDFEVKLKVYQDDMEYNYNENILKFENLSHPDSLPLQVWPGAFLKERENMEGILLEKIINEEIEFDLSKLNQVKIHKVMPNPTWTDNVEYIELINNSREIVNLKWCGLDDILDWWSKTYIFKTGNYIFPWKTKKYYKSETKLNLNNNIDEVNFYCWENKIDNLTWNFWVRSWYYLSHERVDIVNAKVEVIEVIDWDTIKIKFLDSGIIEILRLIWVDTPETKHPFKDVEKYWVESSNFTKKELLWKKVYLEIDKNNFRDKYSRLLGFVFLDWENFNKKLIEYGYWRSYLQYDFKYFLDFEKAEKLAKKQKVWIWGEKKLKEKLIVKEDKFKEKIIEKPILLDENNNWIPDEFEEFMLIKNINTNENFMWNLDEIIDINLLIDEEKSKLKYRDFVINSFYVSVSKLKSWLKISWKTLPNTDIFIELINNNLSSLDLIIPRTFADQIYTTKTDKDWNYIFLITDISSWKYQIETKVIDSYWNRFQIKKQKSFELGSEYIIEMSSYSSKKMYKHMLKYSDEVALENNLLLLPIISIQWQLWTKKIVWNNIYCFDTCNINFDWSKSTWDIEKYIWDFWNWESYEWKNPKYVKYEKLWNYNVDLTIIWKNWEKKQEIINIFFTKSVKKSKKTKSTKNDKNKNVLISVTNANSDIDNEYFISEIEKENNNWNLYFFLIILLSLILVFFLMKREKLI